jgi:predicted acyltransferase
LKNASNRNKISSLVISAVILIIAGYLVNEITPIIKRIATSSFVLVTGGYSILAMAVSYYFIDVLNIKSGVKFFAIVGMNPLFIYLFSHVGGAKLVKRVFQPFSGIVQNFDLPLLAGILNSLITWFFLWYICYWLYRKKILIKI